jgi:hypothetical protein
MFKFMGSHPVVTVILAYLICTTIVEILQLFVK